MRVGFSSSKEVMSKAIMLFTHSNVSHSYIVFEAAGEQLVVQACAKGVICDHYDNFRQKHTIVAEYELLIPPEQQHLILSYALRQLTKSYDFLGILGFAWVLVNKAIGIHVNQPFRNRSSYYCSELIVAALQSANFTTSHLLDQDLTSPEELMEFLGNHLSIKTRITNV